MAIYARTGKYLDLKISYFRDDRRDIYASTDAAAKYLKVFMNVLEIGY